MGYALIGITLHVICINHSHFKILIGFCIGKGHAMAYPIIEDLQLRNQEMHNSDAKKALESRLVRI